MGSTSRSELISAERELNQTKALIDQQYGNIERRKRLGADSRQAIVSLLNLLDLQQSRERRLSYLLMRRTDRISSGNLRSK
jgi:hypothetical protein